MIRRKQLISDEELLSKLPTPGLVGLDDYITWHDLVVLSDQRYPASERLIAAQWIAYCWFKRPIAPQRWRAVGPAIKRELGERASQNGTNRQTELRASVMTALFIAGEDSVDIASPGPRMAFRRKLNNLVIEDLLGSRWRDRPPVEIGQLENVLADQVDIPGEVEASFDLENVIARTHLKDIEAKIVRATFDGQLPDQIANELGMMPGAVRTALSRARKKMKALA